MSAPNEIMSLVLRASKENNVAVMAEILKLDAQAAKRTNAIGQSGLHVAAIWGNLEVALMLIDAGADINAQNQFGVTPLMSAAPKEGQKALDMVRFLVDEGADTLIPAKNGLVAHEVAKTDEMRQLLGAPPLKGHAAVIAADAEALEALLNEGIDVSDQDSDGDTILHLAVKAATGDELVDADGDPIVSENVSNEPPGPEARTMLDLLLKHAATQKGFPKAQILHNKTGKAPLHIAASRGNAALTEALLDTRLIPSGLVDLVALQKDDLHNGQWGKKNEDGKLELLSKSGSTSLHFAVQILHDKKEAAEDDDDISDGDLVLDASLVKVLLKHGANPNSRDAQEQTPLHIAIMGGLHEVVQMLCEAKADVSLGCKTFGSQNNCIHQATILRDEPMIKLLTKHGANIDAPGRDGWTPLCMAVRSNSVAIAKVLVEAKANVDAVSGNGKSALEVATINNRKALIELLKANGAVPSEAMKAMEVA